LPCAWGSGILPDTARHRKARYANLDFLSIENFCPPVRRPISALYHEKDFAAIRPLAGLASPAFRSNNKWHDCQLSAHPTPETSNDPTTGRTSRLTVPQRTGYDA